MSNLLLSKRFVESIMSKCGSCIIRTGGRNIFLAVCALVFAACSAATYEHTTFYIKPSAAVEARIMEIAETVAKRHEMHVTKRTLSHDKEVEPMFRATSSRIATWFGPSTTNPEFTINLAFGFLGISVYYPTDYHGKRTLVSEIEAELKESGIEYSTEFPQELMGGQ